MKTTLRVRNVLPCLLGAALQALVATAAWAGESAAPPPVEREIIPGSELMTSAEREQYRQRMRAAGSREAQAEVRDAHVKRMRERARLRGLSLVEPLGAAGK